MGCEKFKNWLINIESSSSEPSVRSAVFSWKTITPAVATACLLLFVVLNPFAGKLDAIEDLVAYSVANHLNAEMKMEFRSLSPVNASVWFSEKLGFVVKLPDLTSLGLEFLGGRKCALGKTIAAHLYCISKGKKASLFLINADDAAFDITGNRKYVVEDSGLTVTIWKESKMIYALAI